MQLDKDLIFIDPNYFKIIEDYLARFKEIQLKLGKCGKNYQKKDEQLIELVLMSLRTPFNVFMPNFCTNWKKCKEDGKNYIFEYFYGHLITNHHKLLEECKLGGKHQSHLLKGKRKLDPMYKVRFLYLYIETWMPQL
jgi:hypothetical protein